VRLGYVHKNALLGTIITMKAGPVFSLLASPHVSKMGRGQYVERERHYVRRNDGTFSLITARAATEIILSNGRWNWREAPKRDSTALLLAACRLERASSPAGILICAEADRHRRY
jgi:hypothetical protein